MDIKNTMKKAIRNYRYPNVDFDLQHYWEWVYKILDISYKNYTDEQLKEKSLQLFHAAKNIDTLNDLLPEGYALVYEAASRILGYLPHNEQLLAGIALHTGNLVEMKTGEGKTLAAVFPAYLNALIGKGVHILTFNDYLAKRDAQWMGEIYRFLGLTVGYVQDGMDIAQRKQAYSCDITYLTAKEAGFDYLRGFLAQDLSELVQRLFHYAIVDEADSILIDEARIPLVIAGNTDHIASNVFKIDKVIRELKPNEHYETDEYRRSVFLTEEGLRLVESRLNCGNLYDGKQNDVLADVHNALHAHLLLKRDIDYIIRNNRVELVDEFTGRIAEKRNWPHGLQEAVEAKEGIDPKAKGQIMASITLQNFIKQYPKFSGMTGTAITAASEFFECYGIKTVSIPTHKECIRIDEPDYIFTHKEAKMQAVVDEIIQVHKTGRPILVGTLTVSESEELASKLMEAGIKCNVLNARNDALEAEIVSEAGSVGAVTVSTNMAGRGTDIKLGGAQEQDKDKVAALGGLYVIGTNRHESLRVDMQLRGRAGRQGDPGSTRFFISLEDDLLIKYRIKDLIPKAIYPKKQTAPVENPLISREVINAQRIIEGQNIDMRRTLNKYWQITEQQRQIIYNKRLEILTGNYKSSVMKQKLPERYLECVARAGEAAVQKAECQVMLYVINKCWADYLDFLSYIKESIHLVNFAKEVPIFEYNKRAAAGFNELLIDIEDEIVNILSTAEITSEGINLDKAGIKAPSSTWTYLVDDNPNKLGLESIIINPMAAIFSFPLYVILLLHYKLTKKKK